ncbi:homeobox protein knotted-1-like protein 6, partial [Tanacetum coccineum]
LLFHLFAKDLLIYRLVNFVQIHAAVVSYVTSHKTQSPKHRIKVRVEYEWKPPRCVCCKVFGHVQEECPKNLGAGETKNLKKPSQTPKGILKNVKPTKEVSKSNSFDMLNSVENDVELGTNWGTSHLASQEANYSGSSFWNVDSSCPIDKMENLIIDGNVILVDNEGKPLKNVDDDSEDEVALVDNEIAIFLAKKDGYGQEIPKKLQAFCDNLDIKVRGCKKK